MLAVLNVVRLHVRGVPRAAEMHEEHPLWQELLVHIRHERALARARVHRDKVRRQRLTDEIGLVEGEAESEEPSGSEAPQ